MKISSRLTKLFDLMYGDYIAMEYLSHQQRNGPVNSADQSNNSTK